jgi:MoaA/NifB/PqqE/SkfB family radical SAM enzyme
MIHKRLDLDCSKLQWHLERIIDWKAGKRIAPITVDMSLTRACNYHCCFCYSKLQDNPGDPLSAKEIRDTLDDFAEIGVKGVSFVSDGESTCNPYWQEAVQYAARKGLSVALGTNGLLYEPDHKVQVNLTYLRFNLSAARADKYAKIHGVTESEYDSVLETIRESVRIRKLLGHKTTIGIQMVLLPQYIDQAFAVAYLGKGLGVDYCIIKHCSDDERGSLGIRYAEYDLIKQALKRVEKISDNQYQVSVKWSKITAGNKREYERCLAPPFILQISGSGLVAPCGMFFSPAYSRYHIGNLHENRFKEIWASDRYWQVMQILAGPRFNAKTACGCLCLQDATNRYLTEIMAAGWTPVPAPDEKPPDHVNFV